MFKTIAAAILVTVAATSAMPAEARVCRNSHGRVLQCHKVVAPRINIKAHNPVMVEPCRAHKGKFNNC